MFERSSEFSQWSLQQTLTVHHTSATYSSGYGTASNEDMQTIAMDDVHLVGMNPYAPYNEYYPSIGMI